MLRGVNDYLQVQEMISLTNEEELAEANVGILMALHRARMGDMSRLDELGWTIPIAEASARMVAREKIKRGLPLMPVEHQLMAKGVTKGLGMVALLLLGVVVIGLLIVGVLS